MDEVWLPPMSPMGLEVFNAYERFLLVEGSRQSGKSVAIAHRVMRHLIECDGAIVGLFASSKATGDGGVWNDFTGRGGIIPQWIEAGLGISYAVEPRTKPDSKIPYLRIRTPPNERQPQGGESELQLHSIFDEDLAEKKFKSTRFSMIVMVEADNFKLRATFDVLRMQLRSLAVPSSNFQLICDTNPPEEAEDHWLWEVFWQTTDPNFRRIHFDVESNIFLTQEQKDEIYKTYAHDKVLTRRYVFGEWIKATTDGVFADVFLENIHVVGKIPKGSDMTDYEARDNWEILRPDENTIQFSEGYDVGDTTFGYVLAATRYNAFKKCIVADILDELCYSNVRTSLSDVVEEILDRRAYWTRWCREQNGIEQVRFTSYSDTSSLRHRITVNGTEAMEIFRLSDKQIMLSGVRKGSGSVGRRKDLLKRLLFEQRIYFSPLCPTTIEMLRSIKGKHTMAIDPHSPWKHSLDALTYMLGYAVPDTRLTRDLEKKPRMQPMSIAV